jgi:hypothetical protein
MATPFVQPVEELQLARCEVSIASMTSPSFIDLSSPSAYAGHFGGSSPFGSPFLAKSAQYFLVSRSRQNPWGIGFRRSRLPFEPV